MPGVLNRPLKRAEIQAVGPGLPDVESHKTLRQFGVYPKRQFHEFPDFMLAQEAIADMMKLNIGFQRRFRSRKQVAKAEALGRSRDVVDAAGARFRQAQGETGQVASVNKLNGLRGRRRDGLAASGRPPQPNT